jgi:dimethylhistidine N-methyltransferase
MAVYRNQTCEITYTETERFREDILAGLSASPKFLQSKYFYDAEGDKLFQQIMDCPEYYLSRCEMEIFSSQSAAIAQTLLRKNKEFDVVELGAGDAVKSTHLLRYLSEKGIDYTYYPIDISENVIHLLEKELPERIPGVNVSGLNGEYLDMVEKVNLISDRRKVYLFLGSNIGNFTTQHAIDFLLELQKQMTCGDLLLIGFDLKKNPKQILEAYNDEKGVTKAFNLNLLNRINRDLGPVFDLTQFDHYPTYDPITGACRSYIISLVHQHVMIGEELLEFEKNEAIYMELSQKYSVQEIEVITNQTGFRPVDYFFDGRKWFLDMVWEKL